MSHKNNDDIILISREVNRLEGLLKEHPRKDISLYDDDVQFFENLFRKSNAKKKRAWNLPTSNSKCKENFSKIELRKETIHYYDSPKKQPSNEMWSVKGENYLSPGSKLPSLSTPGKAKTKNEILRLISVEEKLGNDSFAYGDSSNSPGSPGNETLDDLMLVIDSSSSNQKVFRYS